MFKRILSFGCALSLFSGLYFGVPLATEFVGLQGMAALAAEAERRETRRVPAMSEAAFRRLSEAQEAVDAENLNQAKQILNDMLTGRLRLNANEIGQVQNMLGFIHYSQENYPEAIRAYQQVLAQGENVPEGLEVQTLYTLAQLSFVADRFDDALRYMETWIQKADNPGPDPHIFMGQVYYQMQNYPAAITQIERGMAIARERNVDIRENWWALLNFLYFEQENWPKVLEILEILVEQFPKREYWVRLAGVHSQEGNDRRAVWTYEAADAGGFLNQQSDYTNFAGMLMQAEVPYRAAKVLETGLQKEVVERNASNLQSLGQAWQLAQEVDKAIPIFQQAARLADDGRIYERLAQLYLDKDASRECVTAADNALSKGGLRQPQSMHIVRGMCLFNQEQFTTARQAFVSCRDVSRRAEDNSNQRICSQWISYIDSEVERRRVLESSAT